MKLQGMLSISQYGVHFPLQRGVEVQEPAFQYFCLVLPRQILYAHSSTQRQPEPMSHLHDAHVVLPLAHFCLINLDNDPFSAIISSSVSNELPTNCLKCLQYAVTVPDECPVWLRIVSAVHFVSHRYAKWIISLHVMRLCAKNVPLNTETDFLHVFCLHLSLFSKSVIE